MAPLAEYGRGFFHTAGYLIDARQSRGLPFGQWATNTRQISAIYWTYLGPALIGLALAHCGLGLWRKSVSGLAAGLCWLGPTAALLLVSQRYYSRYFLFLAPIIVYSAALMLNEKILPLIRRAKSSLAAAAIVAALLAVAPTFPLFWRTLTNPLVADLWPPDRDQYVEGWQSGFGSAAVLQTLRDEARNGRIAVFVAAYAGLYKDLLQLYLSGEPKIEIRVAPWAEQKPLLYFYDRDHPVALAWEPYLPLSPPVWRTAAPLERALFVIDPPQIRLGRFLALNPQARPIFSVYKPGRRSMAAILELPLPGK